jgi:hypothetical protein
MATNTILTDAVITKESLRVLHNTLSFVKGVNREYSSQFGNTGAKIGQSINVRKPNRYTVQQGPAITPQGTTESTVPLTLDRQWVVPMTFSSKELTLHIDEFSNRYIKPAVAKLASTIDLDCASAAVTGYYSDGIAASGGAGPVFWQIGTPGTTPGTAGGSATGLAQYNAPSCFLNAGLILDNSAAPRDGGRTFCLNPAANAQSIGALAGLFNPQGVISDQYKNGLLGNALGFDFVMDQNMPSLSMGTRVASGVTTVQATWTTADAGTIKLTGGATTIAAGDTFTIGTLAAGCIAVNPENQQSTGVLQQFVVTEAVTLSGTTTVKIFPTPKVAAATVADANITRVPTASDVIVFTGAASTVSPQNLAFHKDAFTLGTCDMEIPQGVAFGARESHDGISMRIIRDYDIMNDFMVCRIDVLGGFGCLRPELAVRLAG